MKIKNQKSKIKSFGFTLVELLIVIALIGVLAAALVATLNPIEQINKARDARFKNDASELLAALERYYASTQSYPWVDGTTYTIESEYGETAETVGVNGVGVCGDTCSVNGSLITSGELKPAFKNKDQFRATATAVDKLYIYKEEESSGSTYSCFIPKAGTNRNPTLNPNLVLKDICTGGSATDCTAFQAPVDCTVPTTAAGWADASTACFICVPE